MIPAWAPVNFDFDQDRIRFELESSGLIEKLKLATVIYNAQKQSVWDPEGKFFSDEAFADFAQAPHYIENETTHELELVEGSLDTFRTTNLTFHPDIPNSDQMSWTGELKNNTRIPLWIKHNGPWMWRNDLKINGTKKIIEALPFSYLSTVRCIVQRPPSIGIAHKDSGVEMNRSFYENGFGSITLNICSGGGHLHFVSKRTGKKHIVQEDQFKCWHFDDSNVHCTELVKDLRIQIRVFGKLNTDYKSILNQHQQIL